MCLVLTWLDIGRKFIPVDKNTSLLLPSCCFVTWNMIDGILSYLDMIEYFLQHRYI